MQKFDWQDDSGRQHIWNSTSIKLAEECLYKYKLTMIDGWQAPNKSPHLVFGGHYAAALETYHKCMARGMDNDESTCQAVHNAMIASWEYDEDGESIGPWISSDNLKTRDNLIRSIIWYLDQFGPSDSAKTVILADKSAAVEYSFQLPVDDGIIFSGHLDRFVEYSSEVYVQDQKTTKTTITQRYFDQWNPDIQMSLYTFAGKIIYKNPVKGVIIDAAQIAVGFTRFERGFTFRNEASLDEWYNHTMYTIEHARTAMREQFFPMNRTACGNYGGCPFRFACARSPEVREQFLKSDYVQGTPFSPIEVR